LRAPLDSETRDGEALDLFREAFEHAPDAILMANDEGEYLDGNAAARALLSVTRDELRRLTVEDLTPPDLKSALPEIWRSFLSDGEIRGEYPLLLPSGRTQVVDYHARANFVPGQHLSIIRIAPARVPGPGEVVLSSRQREVLQLLAEGLSGDEIAVRLFLSPETVRTHVRNAMRRLGARTRAQAIAIALGRREIY
jgi:PAS domain S-box-containing protein